MDGDSTPREFTLYRPQLQPGQCPDCRELHPPEEPHNADSLFFQYSFREQHGRWPTWEDAAAHCEPAMQAIVREVLAEHGRS